MKKIILIALLIFSFFSPASAVSDAYLMIGASNAARGVAAASFTQETGVKVIICAKGNTGLKYWNNSIAYRRCINSAKGYNIIGLLFVNGEYEAKYGGSWAIQFPALVAKLEASFGKDLPVAFVRAHAGFPGVYLAQVRADQEASEGCMVNVDDLTLDSYWHYDTPSAVIIGQRLAACR